LRHPTQLLGWLAPGTCQAERESGRLGRADEIGYVWTHDPLAPARHNEVHAARVRTPPRKLDPNRCARKVLGEVVDTSVALGLANCSQYVAGPKGTRVQQHRQT